MLTSNRTLFSLLYENPAAAGTILTDLEVETAHHDRLISYLRRSHPDSQPAVELPPVESMPHVPPRAGLAFSAVVSIPSLPSRA